MKYRAITPFLFLAAAGAFAQEPRSIDEIFSPGFILEDRNGDGPIDFVNAELSLGPSPSAAVVAAASDVATRLGFETMAMNLPLTESRTGVVIAIGAEAPEGAETLESGEGLVTISDASGRPRILVTGADDEGIRAAASYLAGRAPHLWDPKGPTFETLHEDLAALAGTEVRSSRVVEVRATREGLSRLTVALELASPADVASTRRALQAGLGYEGVARISARLVAGDRAVEVEVPRKPLEPKPRPIPPRPGAGAKHEIDLSNLFTPDGLLGDSDQNLIADRIDALLSPAGSYRGAVDLAARLGLEAAGFSIPIARLPEEIEEAEEEPTLILRGAAGAAVRRAWIVDDQRRRELEGLDEPVIVPVHGLDGSIHHDRSHGAVG